MDTLKLLETEQIRSLMVMTVYSKKWPDHALDYSDQESTVSAYTYLQQTGYIEPFDAESQRIPFEVLTEKGIKLATERKPLNLSWLNIGTTVIQVSASIITIAQTIA